MKPKIYSAETVASVARKIQAAPPLPPKFIPHDETIAELSKHIRELHDKKNYDVRQITQLLKESGLRITLREVKNIVETRKK